MDPNQQEDLTPEEEALMQDAEGHEEEAPAPAQEEGEPTAPAKEEPPAAEEPAEPPEQSPEEGKVPIAALHEARNEIRGLKQQLEELTRRLNPPPEKPEVTFEEDPLGHLKQQNDAILERQNAIDAQEAHQAIVRSLRETEEAFEKEHPDYKDAAVYLQQFRVRELANYGITDPQQVAAELIRGGTWLVNNALASGQNPAELLYKTAKTFGYTPKAATPTPPPSAGDVEAIQKGLEVSKSLSQGGAAETPDPDAKALLEMEGEDFDKNWERVMKGH